MGKVKMAVVAHFTFDKKVLPIKIKSEDGATFTVDKVLDVRPAASLKAGGSRLDIFVIARPIKTAMRFRSAGLSYSVTRTNGIRRLRTDVRTISF